MVLDDELYYEIRKLMGVAKFIGTKSNPTPVTDDEILRILRKIGDKSKKIEVEFEEDEAVKVVSGPFRGYTGMISEISAEKGVLKVMISVFGRETPVTLDFDQVEKAV
jgi:transcriptional antiterminator NusG